MEFRTIEDEAAAQGIEISDAREQFEMEVAMAQKYNIDRVPPMKPLPRSVASANYTVYEPPVVRRWMVHPMEFIACVVCAFLILYFGIRPTFEFIHDVGSWLGSF